MEIAKIAALGKNRSIQVAIVLWTLVSVAGVVLSHARVPLDRPVMNGMSPGMQVGASWIVLVVLLFEIGIVSLLTRGRPLPDLSQRAPEHLVAMKETWGLWLYVAMVMVVGRYIGLQFFGEGIGLHLNGSLLGATRVQRPIEVWTWAAYNGILLALVPYLVFRRRGYSREALNLRSAEPKNDLLVIVTVLVIGCGLDFAGPNILQLAPRQRLIGGLLSFFLHMAGTDLPIMIVIYSILLPRYAKLTSPATAFLLGAASYPAMHIFESWTRYDTVPHSLVSLAFVFLTFFPPGVMKSFLTVRTGNAWIHLWGFHAITPHVTVDTRLIVRDFQIRG